MVVGKNLTADLPVAAYSPTNPYSPHDIALASYTGPDYAPQYELLIHGVAAIENTSTQTGTIDILLVNSSPLCGSPYGVGPYGPGRIHTVSIGPGEIVSVPINLIDWVNRGQSSTAHLQYRHASTGLRVKANSYIDLLITPAPHRAIGYGGNNWVSNTPNEGLPFQPENCP